MNPPTPTVDDAQLLERVARRDRKAFAQIYDRYSGILYSTILRILNSPEETAEVLQDVFVQLWDKAGAYDPSVGKPFQWALTMARREAIDRLHSQRRRYNFIEEVTHEMKDPHRHTARLGEVFTQEQAARIRSAVAALPLELRQAIEMAFLGGLTQAEIAEALQQPLGTIKARIRRGMLQLHDSLKPLV